MAHALEELLLDEDFREAVAESAYVRHVHEVVAQAEEHDLSDRIYHARGWHALQPGKQHTYRIAVAEACDQLAARLTDDGPIPPP